MVVEKVRVMVWVDDYYDYNHKTVYPCVSVRLIIYEFGQVIVLSGNIIDCDVTNNRWMQFQSHFSGY